MGRVMAVFIGLAVIARLALSARAGELNWPNPYNTVFTNNATSLTITNGQSVTNSFLTYKSVYHTFEVSWMPIGTNTCTNFFDVSPDNATWANVGTVGAAGTNNQVFQFTGVAQYFRERSTMQVTNGATNVLGTLNIFYAGH